MPLPLFRMRPDQMNILLLHRDNGNTKFEENRCGHFSSKLNNGKVDSLMWDFRFAQVPQAEVPQAEVPQVSYLLIFKTYK